MDPKNFTFEKIFYITSTAMHLNRSHPFIVRNLFWIVQFLIILTLSATSFVFLTNSVLFYDIPAGRYTEASKNGVMSIVSLTITIKYSFLLYFQDHVKNIIEILDKDYKSAKEYNLEEREIIIKYARKGTKASMFWLVAALMASAVFPLKALISMAYSYWNGDFQYIPMFDMRYPNRVDILKNDPAMFWFLFSLCLMFGCYATTMYIGFDPLVPIFLLHTCGQLDVLSSRMLKIFSNNDDSQRINKNLKYINMKLQDLYW